VVGKDLLEFAAATTPESARDSINTDIIHLFLILTTSGCRCYQLSNLIFNKF
jgi:hypothetical protein